ncbi:hypothetical protein [Salidesulfovibrio brasiliensis]|uniref:hypothetical protein n=1 Tax=Salidesulfovibrio brasiliensis TaxID=221711 RepID=UPI00155D878B|nr:hypothetical protein [Salidesulfovibrio brasiliensis]
MANTAPTGARTPQAQGVRSFGTQSMAQDMTNASRRIEDIHDADDFAAARTSWLKGMAELDEHFKEDKDFETLQKRRAEAVQKLRERTLQGVSGRVSRRLTPLFEQAAVKDGVTFGREVQRRRGEHHKARFLEDRDLLVNTVINAQGEQREQARQHLDERLQGIAPYMAETEFARMRDATHDLVTFESARRDIPAMVAEGRAFDPEQYAGLNPAQVSQLDAVYRGEVRRVKREREEFQRDRLAALSPLLEDSLASAMTEGTAMDGTEEMIAELGGLGERGQELAGAYAEQFARVSHVWDVLDSVKDRPFGEQRAAVEVLRPEPGAQGYRADMDMYERAVSQVQQKAKAFADDPAGFAMPEAMRRAENSGVEEDDLAGRAALVLQVQKELGAEYPRILPKEQAARLKEKFRNDDADGKAGLLLEVEHYGDHTRQVLTELGLSHAENFAAMLYLRDKQVGRKVLRAASMKLDELGADKEVAKTVRADLNPEFYSGSMGEVLTKQARLTGDPAYSRMAKELEDLTLKAAMVDGDAEEALESLWGGFSFLTDEELAVAWMPKEHDEDEVEDGLRILRARMGKNSPALHDCVWKNAEDGDGFVLVHPALGSVIEDSFVSYGDAAIAAAEAATEDYYYGP